MTSLHSVASQDAVSKTNQEKYTKIIEVMSDKTLSFGCVINHISFWILKLIRQWDIDSYWKWWQEFLWEDWNMRQLRWGFETIWHPLYIWDVLDWIEKNKKITKNSIEEWFLSSDINKKLLAILKLWKDKRLPLSPTDEELIDYIYNLLP